MLIIEMFFCLSGQTTSKGWKVSVSFGHISFCISTLLSDIFTPVLLELSLFFSLLMFTSCLHHVVTYFFNTITLYDTENSCFVVVYQ